MDLRSLLIVLLSVGSIAGAFYVFVFPILSGEARAEKRQQRLIAKTGAVRSASERSADVAARRKQVSESLKELEQRNQKQKKLTLENRIAQAGLSIPTRNYYIGSGVAALITATLLFAVTGNPLIALSGVLIGVCELRCASLTMPGAVTSDS